LKKSVVTGGEAHYTAEIFASLRLEHATWDDVAERYTRTPTTEAVYLAGIGPVIVAGPFIAALMGGAEGAVAGAALGGLSG
ncbi:MAG TPA: hypothetical protein VLT33_08010, partial [Labilithrix sp.]|nr:hypothetical protein [Labilithrix sp.]